ncbi:MAG TPA: xanthine dehydrogenase family protein molybdopterin-binding subunit [Planctomycetota bacterium]|nr:xanthine dehydrogenase family protein molybdopterin-binding subunit [Planctomycetota bacterium]
MSEEKVTLGFEGHRVEKTLKVPNGDPRPWDMDSKLEVVGKSHARVDALLKATGKARYTHDVRLPGMLWGVILRSPHGAAKIKTIEMAKAMSMPGVKAGITFKGKGQPVLFHGDEVAAVCADTIEQARDAAAAIGVEYEVRPCVATSEDAMKEGAPQVFASDENAVSHGPAHRRGDVEKALETADKTVKATYRTAIQTHSALETSGVVASWEDDKVTVYASTQGTFSVRDEVAGALRKRQSDVRVIAEHVGGGFGAKFGAGPEGIAAVRLAFQAKAPVWMMVDRRGHHQACGNRPDSVQELEGGITKDGKLVALKAESYGTGGISRQAAGCANISVYDIPNTHKKEMTVHTNAGGARAFRAPGHPQGFFALEQMVDELADAIGMDPLEVRIKNDKSEVRQAEWKLGADTIKWAERRNKTPGQGGPILRGVGCAASTWGGHGGPAAGVMVKVDEEGTVEARSGAQDIGTGTRTVIATIVAEELGLEGPHQVRTFLGDTNDPFGPGSGGSRTAASVGPAARAAAAQVKQDFWEALKKSAMKVADSPDGQMRGGKVRLDLNSGEKWVTFAEAVKMTGKKTFQAVGERVNNYGGMPGGVCGCQFAEVEVDTETGKVRVVRYVAVQDCGIAIDKLTAESQVVGGVIQGIGYALFEERILDRKTGRFLNSDFLHYKLPSANDCPEIVPIIFPVAAGINNASMLGIGEPVTIPPAAAIANAFANATGCRIREIPMTPARVLAALEAGKSGKKEYR